MQTPMYAPLYAEAELLEQAIRRFSKAFDVAVDTDGSNVYPNDTIATLVEHLDESVQTIRREIIADAYEQAELVFTPIPTPEGSENVHRHDNLFMAPESVGAIIDGLNDVFKRSPARMNSIL